MVTARFELGSAWEHRMLDAMQEALPIMPKSIEESFMYSMCLVTEIPEYRYFMERNNLDLMILWMK